MSYGYTMDALIYDSGTNAWALCPDYNDTQHRVEITISDDEQTGTVRDLDGNLIVTGQLYEALFYRIQSPTGSTLYLEAIDIDGVVVGYSATPSLDAGITYTEVENSTAHPHVDNAIEPDTDPRLCDLESMPCFYQGTTLMTAEGEQPVDWIRSGDRIMTKDHGFQPVLWAERTVLSANALNSAPKLQPVTIAAQSIDAETPAQDLMLSPEHHVLLKSYQVELLFGIDEVFAPIKSLTNGSSIARTQPGHEVSCYHILFKNHEVVLAEGLWVESYFPDETALASLPARKQAKIRELLGEKIDTMQTARLCLKPWEVDLLVPQHRNQSGTQIRLIA